MYCILSCSAVGNAPFKFSRLNDVIFKWRSIWQQCVPCRFLFYCSPHLRLYKILLKYKKPVSHVQPVLKYSAFCRAQQLFKSLVNARSLNSVVVLLLRVFLSYRSKFTLKLSYMSIFEMIRIFAKFGHRMRYCLFMYKADSVNEGLCPGLVVE